MTARCFRQGELYFIELLRLCALESRDGTAQAATGPSRQLPTPSLGDTGRRVRRWAGALFSPVRDRDMAGAQVDAMSAASSAALRHARRRGAIVQRRRVV